ncbi:MAG: MFS transporter [Candidatus Omnitrophota bacterium]|nr:MAG: MFS transporter [Candidatus Omnitrophota bacterium]
MNQDINKEKQSPQEKTGGIAPILSWAMYDLANQFFALNVISLYFVRWVTLEKKAPEIFYSLAFGISMFFVAILAPILGTISDIRGRRKAFLIYFTLLSSIFTMLLSVPKGVVWGLIFFAIANLGCQEAVVFYNALLVSVSPKNKIGLVSGLGRMFGYSGAILALYLVKPIILERGYQAVFLPTGALFLFFAIPAMIFIKEKRSGQEAPSVSLFKGKTIIEVIKRLRETVFEDYRSRGLLNFLKAIFFLLCAVNVIILFMSVYVSKAFGLTEGQIINLVAFSTIFAIIGSICSGFISDYFGYRRSMMGVFFLWAITFLVGAFARPPFYWVVGALAGTSLGSVWVVSRALAIRLVPQEKIGEAFGLFNLVGYISGILGPIFWGLILLYLSHLEEWGYRIACLSLILFIAIGFIFLLRVPKETKA